MKFARTLKHGMLASELRWWLRFTHGLIRPRVLGNRNDRYSLRAAVFTSAISFIATQDAVNRLELSKLKE